VDAASFAAARKTGKIYRAVEIPLSTAAAVSRVSHYRPPGVIEYFAFAL
jgi:hypothetical protein